MNSPGPMNSLGLPLARAGLGLGVVVAGAVALLLHRTLRPVLEIQRYAVDIRTAADGIVRNLGGAAELARTRDLAAALPDLVSSSGGRSPGGTS